MRLVLVVLVCLLVCGCDRNQKESKLSSEKERLSDDVLRSAASKLLNEKNLILCATGGGMLDQVRMLALSFDYRRPVTITEARGLLIASVQELLDDINTHQLLRPYLHNYPFTPTNVGRCNKS